MKSLTAAGLDAQPIALAQQLLREDAERVRSAMANGNEPGAAVSIAERPVTIPLFLIASLVNSVTGWVSFLHNVPIAVPREHEQIMQALADDTVLALRTYDGLAAGGHAPGRDEISAMFQGAGTPSSPVPAPEPSRLWRPGDPI